jgi:hypothetical protein
MGYVFINVQEAANGTETAISVPVKGESKVLSGGL